MQNVTWTRDKNIRTPAKADATRFICRYFAGEIQSTLFLALRQFIDDAQFNDTVIAKALATAAPNPNLMTPSGMADVGTPLISLHVVLEMLISLYSTGYLVFLKLRDRSSYRNWTMWEESLGSLWYA